MKEDEIFWLGGRPVPDRKGGHLADDENFVAAIRAACEAADCQFDRFISAMGPYGTWLVEINREDEAQRVLWNGKDECMVLQIELSQGGWEDAVVIDIAEQNLAGFVAGVNRVLSSV